MNGLNKLLDGIREIRGVAAARTILVGWIAVSWAQILLRFRLDDGRPNLKTGIDIKDSRRAIPDILVTDDSAVDQRIMLLMLGKLGCRADTAVNGIEALHALEQRPYDVILMDIEMPEMGGLEASEAIRHSWPVEDQPCIIAVTALASKDARQRFIAAGMDEYLRKPVRLDDLKNALMLCGYPMT